MCLFSECPNLRRARRRHTEAITILTGSTNYQGIDGYFCEICQYYCYGDSHLRTTKSKLSLPVDGHFLQRSERESREAKRDCKSLRRLIRLILW